MAKSKKKAAKPAKKTLIAKKSPAKKVTKLVTRKVKPAKKAAAKPAPKKAKPAGKKAMPAAKKAKPVKKAAAKAAANKTVKGKAVNTRTSAARTAMKVVTPVHKKAKNLHQKNKTRYSDSELEEFRQLIIEKMNAAKVELKYLQDQISRSGDNTADDTDNQLSSMDDGGTSMEREYLNQMAARQRLYLDHLDKALVRIKNKTYGICRITGKLIEKERLRAVPHATLSMEAKMNQSHLQPTPANV